MTVRSTKIVKIPEYRLPKPDEMVADRARELPNKGALLRKALERFPFQEPFAAYHPGMVEHAQIRKIRADPSVMLVTDAAFHRRILERSRAREVVKQVESWHRQVEDEQVRHDLNMIAQEADRRRAFFLNVKRIAVERSTKHEKARRLQLAYEQFIDERTRDRGLEWARKAKKKLVDLMRRREEFVQWHESHLYAMGINGGVIRMPVVGQPMETITGKALKKLTESRADEHQRWRDSQFFITRPNGGLVRTDDGGGEARELVLAELHTPILEERRGDFDMWHDLNFLVSTPNGGLQRLPQQGAKMERAKAKQHAPLVAERTQEHLEFHDSDNIVALANGSVHQLDRGAAPASVRATLYWPERQEEHEKTKVWHASQKFMTTVNGSIARLPDVGQEAEKASAEHAKPTKDKRTAAHDEWHATHRFKLTPNGVYAPIKDLGGSIEDVAADGAEPKKAEMRKYFHERYLWGRYDVTPNHAIRRLKTVGAQFEHVTADLREHTQDQVSKRFYDRYVREHQKILAEKREAQSGIVNLYANRTQSELISMDPPAPAISAADRAGLHAPAPITETSIKAKRKSILDFQKLAAAHDLRAGSALRGHAVLQEEPAPTPQRSSKG